MTPVTLQLWHNSASQPLTDPVELPDDPSDLFGECDIAAGSMRMWVIPDSEVRVVIFKEDK